jgi:hypothetical protein
VNHANIENSDVFLNSIDLAEVYAARRMQNSLRSRLLASNPDGIDGEVFYNDIAVIVSIRQFGRRIFACVNDRMVMRIWQIRFQSALSGVGVDHPGSH